MRVSRLVPLAAAALVAALAAPNAEAVLITGINTTQALVDPSTQPSATATRSVVLGGAGLTITDVNITIDFQKCDDTVSLPLTGGCPASASSFSYNREIVFRLTSPDGTTVSLVEQDTYSGQTPGARVQVTFDDSAASAVGGPTLVSGIFRPVSTLTAFNGESPDGMWTLYIEDTVGFDPLGVYGYRLDVEAVPEPGTMLLLGSGIAGLVVRRRRRA